MSRARFQAGIIDPPAHSFLDSANLSHSLIAPAIRQSFLVSDISETLQEVSKLDPFSRLKPYQFDVLYALLPKVHNDKNAIPTFLRQWFDIFNTAVFGGSLTALRDQIYVDDVFPGKPNTAAHYIQVAGLTPDGEIRVNLSVQSPGRTQEEHLVGTLAHEMLHAFFNYFLCPAWIEAMLAIGQAIQDEVRGNVWVGLKEGVQSECEAVPEWEPTENQLIRWDFNPHLLGGIRKIWGQSNPRRDEWEFQKTERNKELQRKQEMENTERIRRETELEQQAQEEADQRHRREEEKRRQEEDRRRIGNTKISKEDEERRRYAHEEAQRRLRAEHDERMRIASQPPRMDPRREQVAPQHHQPPLPPPAPAPSSASTNPFVKRGAEMIRSQQQLAASNSNANRRRAEDPEVANERTLRGRIGKVSERLFGRGKK